MPDLSLFDLILPYVLQGVDFGPWHPALSVLRVTDHETAIDDSGVVIRGTVKFTGNIRPSINLRTMTFAIVADNQDNHPKNEPGTRAPWIDIRDAGMEFQLTVPRLQSAKIVQAMTMLGGIPEAVVINTYGRNPPPDDYPNTEFILDFIVTSVVLRPPFLRGAKRVLEGQLVADPENQEVKFTLPKIKMRLAQGSAIPDQLTVSILSLGASGLDDPGDLGVAELVTMDPPYAFIGSSDTVGFGFRSGVLDLSNGATPPEVLAKFGYDDSWQGLYLPEIRLFIAPNGARDLAIDGGARDLLIGFGQSSGITGDFELQAINQGAGSLNVGARFYDQTQRSYGITVTKVTDKAVEATVALPDHTRMIVDVDGGLVPYTVTATDASPGTGREHTVEFSQSEVQKPIVIIVDDSSVPVKHKTLTITASRLPAPAALPPGLQQPGQTFPVNVRTTLVTKGKDTPTETPVSAPRLTLISETPTQATIALNNGAVAMWTIGNAAPVGPSATVTFDVGAGASVEVKAVVAGEQVKDFTAFYRYDHPKPTADPSFATIRGNSRTGSAPDEGVITNWSSGSDSMDALRGILVKVPDSSTIKILGYASFEGDDSPQSEGYNTALAQRRADGLRAMIEKATDEVFGGPPEELKGRVYQFDPLSGADMSNWKTQGTTLETRREYWKAVAVFDGVTTDDTEVQGIVSRQSDQQPQGPPAVVPDPPPASDPPPPPSWFRKLGGKVRIVRDQFVACEVFGKFDYQTAAEARLQEGGVPPKTLPGGQLIATNEGDGLIDIRVVVQFDDATDTVTVIGYFGADPADQDGLVLWAPESGEPPNYGLDFLGISCVFLPAISAASDALANEGSLAQVIVGGAAFAIITALAGFEVLRTERVIWYGAELKVVANKAGDWSATILFDIETALSAENFPGGLIFIPRTAPVVVRYKAIGIMLGDPSGAKPFQFRPMFDSSKGYTIDLSRPGAIQVKEPLGDVLQILGAQIAKNNPLVFDVELGFAIDLGVVTIEKAGIRLILPENGSPSVELSAFGASVDIPGALTGRGYVKIGEGEFTGQLDLTIVPIKVRIAAELGIKKLDSADGFVTAVIVTLDVSFPVAIPLGTSGLGIYGFIGLFAMHWSRDESGLPAETRALAWLKKVGGVPTDIKNGWKPEVNRWAFGVGALLGTMGSEVIFNLKGMVILELPGPRLLLMLKANFLIPPPELKNDVEGLLLAVLDLDMGRGTLTIGISAQFSIEYLLTIQIPIEAFFNFEDPKDWHLYLGQYSKQIQADVLSVFEGSGYLMISGNGLKNVGDLPEVTGFSIAVGLHVSFIWGSKPVGLYAELAAGLDAIVGFDPFRFAGILYVRGSLVLWIIDISAWASLRVDMGESNNGKVSRIEGELCGRVEFLFFTIEGCLDFVVGSDALPVPDPPDLIRALKLISRSPAMVQGSGSDRPIDAAYNDAYPTNEDKNAQPADEDLPKVPIDTIPLLMMCAPPLWYGVKFKGTELNGSNEGPSDGWVARGDSYFKYTLKSVELSGTTTDGATPATWWMPKSGDKAYEAQLALLSWIPEATPKAIEYSKYLEDWVKKTWGTICLPAAPPTPVLWTFLQELLGPSPVGWWLDGTAWPDPPNTIRSAPTNLEVKVTERWRSGDPKLDHLRAVVPAVVEGAPVPCPPPLSGSIPAQTKEGERTIAGRVDVIGVARGIKSIEPVVLQPRDTEAMIRDINRGVPVLRSSFFGLAPEVTTGQLGDTRETSSGRETRPAPTEPTEPRNCHSRVLAAPLFDDYWRATFNPVTYRDKYIRQQLAQRKYTYGPLIDAVVIHTGNINYATFFLFVTRQVLLSNQLVVAIMNSKETILSERVVTSADAIPNVAVPAKWTDPSGPWYSEMFLLLEHQKYLEPWGYQGVIVTVDRTRGCHHIQIGLKSGAVPMLSSLTHRPFYIAAIEVVRREEELRFDYDTKEQSHKKEIAGAVLNSESGDYALLQKDTVYSVTVTWDAQRERRPKGQIIPTDLASVSGESQTFWFRTDDKPPDRLDPWMLAALPTEGERHYFANDGMKLVFATNNVVRLYETYDKRLQVRLRASSSRPPPGTPKVLEYPLILDATSVEPVSASVLDPFEEALENLLDGSCVPVDGKRIRHSKVDIDTPLDTFTDYVLDIEMVGKDEPDGATGPVVWRRRFSTGSFRTLKEFAQSFFTARVVHRAIKAGAMVDIKGMFTGKMPQGNELDQAFIAKGLEPLEVPDRPRLMVFWETGSGDPQPTALLIDSSEPLWRSRMLPRSTDPGPDKQKRYVMEPVPWLEVKQQSGGDDLRDGEIIRGPGNQRALIILKPDSRNKHVKFALRRIPPEPEYTYLEGLEEFFTIADFNLKGAPWEETED